MRGKLLLLLCCMALGSGYAQEGQQGVAGEKNIQENFVNHKVLMGETVALVAKKYKVTPQDIYEYNPDTSEGIGKNMQLRIPLHRQVDLSAPKKEPTPLVYQKKEPATTGRSKSIGTSVQPSGSIAQIVKSQPVTEDPVATAKTDTPVAEIKEQALPVVAALQETPATQTIATKITSEPGTYKVQYGDTLYSLARKYGVSVGQLTAANKKTLRKGLQSGQTLVIPKQ